LLISERNRITLKKGYGYSNNTTRKLNTPQTLFNVASIGKTFTAYSILLLEQRGLLKTSDRLSKYIGAFNDIRDSVTIHHLLLHTSGLFKEGTALEYGTRAGFIKSVKENSNESAPGKVYRYSNAGYSMLAAIIEITSGQRYEDFVFQNIFRPLKMKSTGYPWERRIDKKLLATGYNSKHQPMPVQEDEWGARGPGNLVTSVEDLYKWIKAFDNKKFMSPAIKNKLLYDHSPGRESYSWSKAMTSRATRFYHKGGGRADFESRMLWYPDDEVIIIFSLNNDYNLARILFNNIRLFMN